MRPIDLTETYLQLHDGAEVEMLDVDEQFWETIDERADLQTGRLVMASAMTADWDGWEMHPAGDEVILVTEGTVRVHTDGADPIEVSAPDLVLMPAGTWHTMDVVEAARVVTITAGAGTQHRPRQPGA